MTDYLMIVSLLAIPALALLVAWKIKVAHTKHVENKFEAIQSQFLQDKAATATVPEKASDDAKPETASGTDVPALEIDYQAVAESIAAFLRIRSGRSLKGRNELRRVKYKFAAKMESKTPPIPPRRSERLTRSHDGEFPLVVPSHKHNG